MLFINDDPDPLGLNLPRDDSPPVLHRISKGSYMSHLSAASTVGKREIGHLAFMLN